MKRFKLKLLLVCALTILFGATPGTAGISLASPGQPGHFRIGYSRGGSCHLIPDTDHVVVGLSCTDDILEGYSCAPLGAQVVEVRYSVFIESHPLEQISCNDYEIYLSSDNHGGATKHLLVYDNLGSMRDGGHDDDPENDHDIYLEWRSTHAFDGENPNQNWYLWVEDTQGWNRGCLASVDFEIHWLAGPPQNDDCSNASSVGNVTNLHFDTTEATYDGPACTTGPNLWYCYTATCTGNITVSLCGSSFDTKLAVYEGCNCYPTPSDLIECNNDYCGQQSQITFTAVAGNQYLIEVGGDGNKTGQGVLSISCEEPPGPELPNDDCSKAIPVGDVTNLPFDTTEATFDGPGLCMTSPNIWYCYTATCTGEATVSLCGSNYDTMLAVYEGCGCPTGYNIIACIDEEYWWGCEQYTFDSVAGQQYLIEVGGYEGASGEGVLSITCEGVGPPPTELNDDCSKARPVGDVTNLPFDTTEATFDGSGLCMTSPNLWYCYTATCTGDVTVSLCGSSYDTKLAVYKDCYCYLTPGALIECNDDYPGCSWQSQITFAAIAGNQYLIEVGGYGNKTGQGVLTISCEQDITANLDFGDAPDSTNNFGSAMTAYTWGFYKTTQANFPTVFNDGSIIGPFGPFHRHPLAVAHLGQNVSLEVEADIGPDQDGVNNIHPPTDSANKDGADDGVILPLSLPDCGWDNIDYTVKVINPGTDLYVNVWLDWNRDGDWDDNSSTDPTLNCGKGFVSEWAVQNQLLFNLPAGLNQISTPAFMAWHPQDGPTKIWMRITLSEQPWKGGETPGKLGNGGSGPQAGYDFGETEDYLVTPIISEPDCALCEDLNGDGKIDNQDLNILVNQWLAKCM